MIGLSRRRKSSTRKGNGLMVTLLLALSMTMTNGADNPAKRTADEVLLVCNERSPVSKTIAQDYAQNRGIKHRLSIQCIDSALSAPNETISLEPYLEEIETPIRRYLAKHAGINFIVLTKGMPIRISGLEKSKGAYTPEVPQVGSLDSRLAALDYDKIPGAVRIPISGSGASGSAWINRYYNEQGPFSHAKFGGYLVTRLDGYTEADAKSLVHRALLAEAGLTEGTVLLDVQPGFGLGNKAEQPGPIREREIRAETPWSDFNADMLHAGDVLKSRKIACEVNVNPAFVGHRSGLLGYFSWGSNDSSFSSELYQTLAFAPGSICDTAVSSSGRTFLPTEGGQTLLVDLIAHGLTCGKGYVDEPLLQAIASPTITLQKYTSGYTMAESLYAASHFVGWKDVVVGDALCAPYRPK